ncbi:Lanosterol 14-alpha demethylase [Sparassis crispa]|uniref:Lanosterol 14-alpha demethylase n=1 Tax=Sparassis crispa TaxID=139825 RepID=A0A401H1R2_9APHY|nr:Lanosterol 14-alpha demethylase [Sparassis crispa]GBE88329.1 Lanosterol 14-alpha demethylase [Sparassis crispa]
MVFHWIPLLGSSAAYGRDPVRFLQDCQEKYGNVFTFILLGRRVTVTLGSKGNDFVLGGKHTILAAEDVYASLTKPVFGEGVVHDCPNELLMEQKKFVKYSLTIDNFRSYVGMVEDEVLEFMRSDPEFRVFQKTDNKEWGSFNLLKVLSEITILTASRTLQGKEIRENMDKGFAQLFHDLDNGFTPLHFIFQNLPLPSYWKRDAANAKMTKFYQQILQNRRVTGEDPEDVMSSLAKESYRDGRPLEDYEIAHIMIALLMAGQHTSSSSSAWTLLRLADNPDVAQKLYQEQVDHFSAPDRRLRDMTYDEMRSLPILDAVIRETLRLHPPIHSIFRMVRSALPMPPSLAAPSEDSVYVVPKGDIVLASPAVSQVDPTLWKDGVKWEPSRWLDVDGFAVRAQKSYDDESKVDFGFGLVSRGTESPYLPFGAGRHRCIGEQFAYLQVGAIITTFIRNIEFRLEEPFPKSDYTSMMVQPFPCHIAYRRRNLGSASTQC